MGIDTAPQVTPEKSLNMGNNFTNIKNCMNKFNRFSLKYSFFACYKKETTKK